MIGHQIVRQLSAMDRHLLHTWEDATVVDSSRVQDNHDRDLVQWRSEKICWQGYRPQVYESLLHW